MGYGEKSSNTLVSHISTTSAGYPFTQPILFVSLIIGSCSLYRSCKHDHYSAYTSRRALFDPFYYRFCFLQARLREGDDTVYRVSTTFCMLVTINVSLTQCLS